MPFDQLASGLAATGRPAPSGATYWALRPARTASAGLTPRRGHGTTRNAAPLGELFNVQNARSRLAIAPPADGKLRPRQAESTLVKHPSGTRVALTGGRAGARA